MLTYPEIRAFVETAKKLGYKVYTANGLGGKFIIMSVFDYPHTIARLARNGDVWAGTNGHTMRTDIATAQFQELVNLITNGEETV